MYKGTLIADLLLVVQEAERAVQSRMQNASASEARDVPADPSAVEIESLQAEQLA